MNQLIKVLFLVACITALSGCGLKGPLYQPTDDTASITPISSLLYKVV